LRAGRQQRLPRRARDRDARSLERLAQRLQRATREFWQLVGEEDAAVRERDFARSEEG
jgi:guanylate kinase